MFEEELHGAAPAGEGEEDEEHVRTMSAGGHEKDSSAESASGISVDEEERAKKL